MSRQNFEEVMARVKQRVKMIKEQGIDAVKKLHEARIAPPEVVQYREAICNACPEKLGPMCGACKCVLKAKQRFKNAACPIGKWPAVADSPSQKNEAAESPPAPSVPGDGATSPGNT